MSSANPLKDADIDRLVLQYLRKRKFSEAEKVLQLELKEQGAQPMALQHLLDSEDGVIENLLFNTEADGEPAAYLRAFDRLATWVDNSLDLYRYELSRLLYPVLVHCYLNLISLGATAEAQQLLAAHKQRFVDAAGGPSKRRMQELHDLQSVAVAEHLQTNRSARALRAVKFSVRLCSYSYQLLTHFMQGNRMLLVLAVINEHLKLEVFEGPPSAVEDAGGLMEEDALAGVVQHEALTTNQKPLQLQLLQGNIEDKYAQKQAEQAEQEAKEAFEAGEEQKGLTKKQKEAQKKAMQEAKEKREAVGTDRMAPEVPLPEVSEQWEGYLLREIGSRATLSSQALPSCAFYTFVNTHQSLNCVSFTSDAACVAGGFGDSSVRVYDLSARAAGALAGAKVVGRDPVTNLSGHSGPVYGLDYSPDNQLLFSCSADGSVRLWSMEVRANLVAYRGHMLPVWSVACCPHVGFYFASCGADRTARVWNTERAQALRILAGHQSDVDVVRWHPNCHYVATGSADRTVRLWDIRSGECCRIFVGHRAGVTSLAFSPDGSTLCSGDAGGGICMWDLAAAKRTTHMSQHTDSVWSLAFSEGDGNILASGAADCTVQLWDAKGPPQQPSAGAAAALPAGTTAAGSAAKGSDSLAHLRTLRTKATPVFGLRFTTRNLLLGSGALTLYRPPKMHG
ncbi:hypothetical protein N2152v2_010582 [Parachlorella kessleri]